MKLKRRLHLAKETVRALGGSELREVGGGRTDDTSCYYSCDPVTMFGSFCLSCRGCSVNVCV